jgi:biotin synthase
LPYDSIGAILTVVLEDSTGAPDVGVGVPGGVIRERSRRWASALSVCSAILEVWCDVVMATATATATKTLPLTGPALDVRLRQVGEGRTLGYDELLALLATPATGADADRIRDAACALTRHASGNRGQVFAQIGLDALPCPADCRYCSFAARNTALEARDELSLDEVVGYARVFDAAGIHLISLMVTAAYRFDRYLQVIAAVRAAIRPTTPLLANAADLTREQAERLRAAGADVVYHAVRLREGRITDIAPERRRQTIANVRAAGLRLMTGVEPLFEELEPSEIADRIFETLDMGAVCTGVCPLVLVPGSRMAHLTPPSDERRHLIGALYRLAVGTRVPFGMGGLSWVDAGTNPRGRHLSKDAAELAGQVEDKRRELVRDGWELPATAPAEWFR